MDGYFDLFRCEEDVVMFEGARDDGLKLICLNNYIRPVQQ